MAINHKFALLLGAVMAVEGCKSDITPAKEIPDAGVSERVAAVLDAGKDAADAGLDAGADANPETYEVEIEPSNNGPLKLKDIFEGQKRLKGLHLRKGTFLIAAVKNIASKKVEVKSFDGISPANGGAKPNGNFSLQQLGRTNGINTAFQVVTPKGWSVLALKRKMNGKEVVYTPFTEDLNTVEIRTAGLRYLSGLIKTAKENLSDVPSRLKFPAPAENISVSAVENLIGDQTHLVLAIIEHMDDALIKSGKSTMRAQFERSLATIGANRDSAFNWSGSGKSALGLYQIIPTTYDELYKLFPTAEVEEDFVGGATDHTNATMMALLHSNRDLTKIDPEFRKWLIKKENLHFLREVLAVAYNGGPGRVDNFPQTPDIFKNWNWLDTVPEETQIYVKKAAAVDDFLSHGKI